MVGNAPIRSRQWNGVACGSLVPAICRAAGAMVNVERISKRCVVTHTSQNQQRIPSMCSNGFA